MNIAIFRCRKSNDVCTGYSCLNAFYNKKASFDKYNEEDRLIAFFDCGGCGVDRKNDPGIQEKMELLVEKKVDIVHIGICINKKCKEYDDMIEMLERYKINYTFGTH